MLKELVKKSRSTRRFVEKEPLSREFLTSLVELARFVPSAGNLQKLRYRLVFDPEEVSDVFAVLGWAAYLKDWRGPAEGERPPAYIVICGPLQENSHLFCDLGIAAQTMALGAREAGYGTCMLANFNQKSLQASLHIPEDLQPLLVIALGRPAEEIRLEDMGKNDYVHYWRDEKGVHHVPKRLLADLILQPAEA